MMASFIIKGRRGDGRRSGDNLAGIGRWPIHFHLIGAVDAKRYRDRGSAHVADLTDVLTAVAKDGHAVTPALVACLSPYIRDHIRRFVLDMDDFARRQTGWFLIQIVALHDLPNPLDPQPLPFEIAL